MTETVKDRKKSRELAEARQSGAVAPAVDIKTGSMINPHNPEFLTKRPWYLGQGEGPSLDHQVEREVQEELTLQQADRLLRQKRLEEKQRRSKGQFQVNTWVEALKNNKRPYRISKIIKIAKKGTEFDLQYEDGTVERKVKLKNLRMTKTGNRTFESESKETYDSKRDAYHGYDQEAHLKKTEKIYQEREKLRRERRTHKEKKENKDFSDSDSDFDDSDDSEDEFVQRDEDAKTFTSRLARQGGVGGAQMKVTARNLRIREDTAKYLRNLNVDSAYYDPKSRSMRDNPNPEAEDADYGGDNFARISGDAVGLADTQLFAWEASEKGVAEIHPQANPSQAELLKKKFKTKSQDLKVKQKKAVLDKYGGAEYLDGGDGLASAVDEQDKMAKEAEAAAERKARFGVSITEEEYAPDGRLIKGSATVKRVALKSKYEENVYINGHTTVWGSYFHRGAFLWGYADDHSLMKNSYCTGENGRIANDEANEMRYGTGVSGSAALAQAREMLKAIPTGERKTGVAPPAMSKLYGEADQNAKFDKDKLDQALKKLDQSREEATADRKRKYNSMNAQVDVTEEEMEAYRMRKDRGADPMAKLASSDEILDYK